MAMQKDEHNLIRWVIGPRMLTSDRWSSLGILLPMQPGWQQTPNKLRWVAYFGHLTRLEQGGVSDRRAQPGHRSRAAPPLVLRGAAAGSGGRFPVAAHTSPTYARH